MCFACFYSLDVLCGFWLIHFFERCVWHWVVLFIWTCFAVFLCVISCGRCVCVSVCFISLYMFCEVFAFYIPLDMFCTHFASYISLDMF